MSTFKDNGKKSASASPDYEKSNAALPDGKKSASASPAAIKAIKIEQSFLDPRTKLLLLFTLPTFLLSEAGGEYFRPVRLILSLLPIFILLVSAEFIKGLSGLALMLFLSAAWHNFAPALPGPLYILCLILYGLLLKLLPCILLAAYVLNNTKVGEFIAGMKKLKIPDSITIPLSVIFRFFPTVIEETKAIDSAMSMREINLKRASPTELFEYRAVPAMISSLKIGDELSAAALSRGLAIRSKELRYFK